MNTSHTMVVDNTIIYWMTRGGQYLCKRRIEIRFPHRGRRARLDQVIASTAANRQDQVNTRFLLPWVEGAETRAYFATPAMVGFLIWTGCYQTSSLC